jgi:hypothetical protein
MLESSEKAYCAALSALERKQFREAKRLLDAAAPNFAENREFGILYKTVNLLCQVKDRIAALEVETTNSK